MKSSNIKHSNMSRGPYIYDVHTEGGWGSLKLCHVFVDSIVFKQ